MILRDFVRSQFTPTWNLIARVIFDRKGHERLTHVAKQWMRSLRHGANREKRSIDQDQPRSNNFGQSSCNIFVRLTSFEEVPSYEVFKNVVYGVLALGDLPRRHSQPS